MLVLVIYLERSKCFCEGALTCSFELLGASIVSRLVYDSYFMIKFTNYIGPQNKIATCDYYGTLFDEMECKSLITATVCGEKENEVVMPPPEIIVKLEIVTSYVPPFSQGSLTLIIKPMQKPVEMVKRAKRTKEIIQNELDTCLKAKRAIQEW